MFDSDDFGLNEDDTAFLAVATQVEADNHEFDDAPRPSKRRRISQEYDEYYDCASDGGLGIDDELIHHRCEESRADDEEEDDKDDDGYYFPGELGNDDDEEEARRARMAKYKIHVGKSAKQLPTVFMTQTQVGLDENPAAIRGPIWKRPPAVPTASHTMPAPPLQQQQPRAAGRSVSANNLDSFVLRPNQNSHNQLSVSRPSDGKSRQAPSNGMSRSADTSFADDYGDISSDAFESPATRRTAERPAQAHSQSTSVETGRRGPQTGLKQMTIFGQAATQELSSTQAAKKRYSFPIKAREEPPTHHELNPAALETFTYPTNLGTIRDYQFNIVSRSLLHNTLVALPTGLGKTFIAATIMLNYHRWTSKAQIVFMAPTKPLIAQQMEACYGIVGIPRCDTVLMTGETQPAIRAEEWSERRVFFMTPQTVINDLKTGICDPKRIVLVVVDEAHKATGGYAYTEVVKFLHRFNPSFRVLALTATPGSTVEAVQSVIDNLGIARVELRTESSLDIRQYTHEKHTETQLFDFSEEQTLIMDLISRAIQPVLNKLTGQNAYWSKDPMSLTAYGLTTARARWMQSDAGKKAPWPVKGPIMKTFSVLASLAHALSLLKFHGIGIFCAHMKGFAAEEKADGKQARQIVESADFLKAMNFMRTWCNNIDFVGHPKMEYLREVVMNHFLDAGEGQHASTKPARATRVMIFSSFRDSTDEICRVLKRSEPLVRPHVFVGQAASKNSEGMDQKKQNKVIQDFKDGVYNTLVATSIGEEGLDIGDVDLIICYDASSSPIRMLQRIGRTGRKRIGRVVLLLMRGKEENDYAKAQDSYAYIQKSIADSSRYSYRDDQSPRIVPNGISPVAVKRIVEIPPENSQPLDLNERARRRKGKGTTKRPPKKFHMPDGVRTGFVKASALGSESDDDGDDSEVAVAARRPKAKRSVAKRAPTPPPEPASIPFLEDVLLTASQLRDHECRYMRTTVSSGTASVQAPDPAHHPDTFRTLGPTRFIAHGRVTALYAKALSAMHNMTDLQLDALRCADPASSAELQSGVQARLSASISTASSLPAPIEERPKARGGLKKPAASRKAKTAGRRQNLDTSNARTSPAGRCKRPRRTTPDSGAEEGTDSSPDPTPNDMRIGTQGIELGSRDTSGEDDEEEADSDLDQFVVGSDQPIEMASSSVPMEHEFSSSMPKQSRRPLSRRVLSPVISEDEAGFSSDDDQNQDELNDPDETESGKSSAPLRVQVPQAKPSAQTKASRVIADSDSDD